MTEVEFQHQLGRLSRQWPNAYGSERATIIWREVRDFPAGWFCRQVDEWIGGRERPPLLTEIREATARARERFHDAEKRRHSEEAERFMSSYGPEETRVLCKTIIDRMNGGVPDAVWDKFVVGLDQLARRAG